MTTTTDPRRAKYLEKVRALLAKADSTTFPEEAASLRAKADELMATFAIEQWQVDQAQSAVYSRPEPEIRHMEFTWWVRSPFSSDLWSMFHNLAYHCRCVVALRGYQNSQSGMPVIGLPSDLDYLDLLFTSLMVEMSSQLEPRVNSSESLGANVYRLRQAGQPWDRITRQVFEAGLVKLTAKEIEQATRSWRSDLSVDEIVWKDLLRSGAWENVKNRLANANRKYVRENGLQEERNYVKPKVYQRSFAYGFTQMISERLAQLRRDAEPKQTGSMELALRDIRQAALDLYNATWVPPKQTEKTRSRAVSRQVAYDNSAIGSGREAGRRADISGSPARRVGAESPRLEA